MIWRFGYLASTMRHLRNIPRMAELLVFWIIQPIMFVLLFAFVLGGAIQFPGGGYRSYLMAGSFAQTVASALWGFLLLLLFGFAMSRIGACIGLIVPSAEVANTAGFTWSFPLTFMSNAFVPI